MRRILEEAVPAVFEVLYADPGQPDALSTVPNPDVLHDGEELVPAGGAVHLSIVPRGG